MSISLSVRDPGRLVMLPVAVCLAAGAAGSLSRGLGDVEGRGLTTPVVLRWVTTLLACCFYAVLAWCYLRRGRAVATSRSGLAHLAAVAATVTPFCFALLPAAQAGVLRSLAASVLLVAGTAWSVWALRSLGRSFGILAQARVVVQRGPYRWVRHPLYLGEVVACLGLALNRGTVAAALLWVGLCAMQVYRASREEEVLARSLPDYAGYRLRTSALLPGVF
jgi:protein-S-isoprenylcysteine O-methyltransferase Ste14